MELSWCKMTLLIGISEAAEKLMVSQPSLSQLISKLEDEIGVQLFERTVPLTITYFFDANEKINKGQIRIRNSKGVYTGRLYSIGEEKYLSNENMFHYQAEVIKTLALEGKVSCIIIGKGANKIIGSLKNVVTVNIQAPMDICVGNITNRLQINTVQAREMIIDYLKYKKIIEG